MLPTNPLLNATAPAGPHLPLALLRQYATGALAPAAQHRVEAHTLGCPRCADILEGLLQTPPATTDQAVAQLQQRLRQRVQQVAAPGRQGPRLAPRPRWLALQLAAAATLLLSLVAGGWWAWQQRHLAAPTVAVAPGTSSTTATPLATSPLSSIPTTKANAPKTSSPALAPGRARAGRVATYDTVPSPAGGMASFRKKLRRQAATFIPKAPARPLSGTVQLRLTIDATGKLTDIRVIRGLRADYDAEAQRLVNNGPSWVPSATRQVDVAVPF